MEADGQDACRTLGSGCTLRGEALPLHTGFGSALPFPQTQVHLQISSLSTGLPWQRPRGAGDFSPPPPLWPLPHLPAGSRLPPQEPPHRAPISNPPSLEACAGRRCVKCRGWGWGADRQAWQEALCRCCVPGKGTGKAVTPSVDSDRLARWETE